MRSTGKRLVSVIVPTFNEERNIARLIKSINAQTYLPVEVLVVDDGSTDSTCEIAKKHGAKVFERSHAERSTQRNFGAKKSAGSYLLFLDGDMELSKKVVEKCVTLVGKDKSQGAVVIPEKSVATNFWERVKDFERTLYNLEGDETTDAARFFAKEAFLEVGGYDETITGPEDWDLPEAVKQKGYKIGRINGKIYHHERIPSLLSLARKKYYYALKSHRYLKKYNISAFSAKTVYFLRPVFYKNWKRFLINPVMSFGMVVMLTVELIAGALGFTVGSLRKL